MSSKYKRFLQMPNFNLWQLCFVLPGKVQSSLRKDGEEKQNFKRQHNSGEKKILLKIWIVAEFKDQYRHSIKLFYPLILKVSRIKLKGLKS